MIPFPTFESHLTPIIDSAHELHLGERGSALRMLKEVHGRLRRVHGSIRHSILADYVGQALQACERDECEFALATLMNALNSFIPEQAA